MAKIKISKCDKYQTINLWQLKISNCNPYQNFKLWQNSNGDKKKSFLVKKKTWNLKLLYSSRAQGLAYTKSLWIFFSENHIIDKKKLVFLANIYYFEWYWRICFRNTEPHSDILTQIKSRVLGGSSRPGLTRNPVATNKDSSRKQVGKEKQRQERLMI